MVLFGKTELQVPHFILNQPSIQCCCTLHYFCVTASITSSNETSKRI